MPIPRPEHPRPERRRAAWLNLNGTWDFAFGDTQDPGTAAYDRAITVPFSWAAPLSGIAEDRKDTAWYRRDVSYAPREGRRLFLCVGAADYHARVFVNGRYAGEHVGGYTPFDLDVTDAWTGGGDRIEIRVEDQDGASQTRGKQGYGEIRGLWQTVWLEERPAAHIAALRIKARLDGEVLFTLSTVSPTAQEARLTLDFGTGARRETTVRVPAGTRDIEAVLRIDDPRAWSPEDPHLYEGAVTLGEDAVHTYFGLRAVGAAAFGGRAYPWITLNGCPVYLSGTLDQSFNPDGFFTLPSEEEAIREVRRLKDIGLNCVRVHIKPEEPIKLYWMDKLGILCMEDMPNYWGPAVPEAQEAWERQAFEVIARDYSHPCIISWVLFNETWGLFSGEPKVFSPATQEWVRAMYRKAKAADGARLIEDHSPCNHDHVETDLNTFHYYISGYGPLRDYLRAFDQRTHTGSEFNYIGGNRQAENTPWMNSECGMVWGVDGSAGDSDLAWHYRYMVNETRLHEKMCGFIFTEFHDVVNEWNGYYRIDGGLKSFGYGEAVPGMTLRDLHAPAFPCLDAPPCRTVGGGERVDVPVRVSCFDGSAVGSVGALCWTLSFDGPDGRQSCAGGEVELPALAYGLAEPIVLSVVMPRMPAVAILGVALRVGERTLSRNYIAFDVRAPLAGAVQVRPRDYAAACWRHRWAALDGDKQNGAGAGYFEYEIGVAEVLDDGARALEVLFEAGAKQVLRKDLGSVDQVADAGFMHGYRQDPGENANSYPMTDGILHPSKLAVWIEGQRVAELDLPDDPADARGVLSWHYQLTYRVLDEAGSYGYLCRVRVPEDLMPEIRRRGKLTLRLEAVGEPAGGLAVYGRNSGRYPWDIVVRGI